MDQPHVPRAVPLVLDGLKVSILVLLDQPPRVRRPAAASYTPKFQSLFCWISLFGRERTGRMRRPGEEFQSLFCWISLHVRIPVGRPADRSLRFQSLFCWISPHVYLHARAG